MIVLATVATTAVLPLALAAALVAAVGMAATKIEWAEETWNPTTGCTRVSPGCDRCYMFSEVERRRQYDIPGKYAAGTAVTLHPRTLDATASVLTPSKVFVNSMSDLLHEAIPDEFVYEVFEAMGRAPWHLYMVLTKRERRLAELGPHLPWGDYVMAGVSVEDAERTYRLDALRACGARRTFVSFEPLLGSVLNADGHIDLTGIDYAIVGGESDSNTPGEAGARPMRPEWAREIRDASIEQGVAFHFKQWGAHDAEGDLVGTKRAGRELDGRTHDDEPEWYGEFMRHACLQAAAVKTSARGAHRG